MRGLVVLLLVGVALLPGTVAGQTFENTPQVMITAGTSTPVGGISDFWSTGPQGKLTIRVPLGGSMAAGLQGGLAGPRSSDDNSELLQVPLRGLIYFPLAPEASGTPYLAVGVGPTINAFTCRDESATCYLDKTKVYFAYSLVVGYTMRPEAMAHAFFDFAIRYDQQVINNEADFTGVDAELSIGLAF